jgi:peptidoglycan/xylan/chitin deacetylase (PgdA/CDA1 family)
MACQLDSGGYLMNAPYLPSSSIWSRFNRQWARFSARTPISVDLDHAIVSFSFDDFPKSAAIQGAQALEAHNWRGTYYASAVFAGQLNHHGEMFDATDLQRLETAGHEIGCHTYEHLDCAKATTVEIMKSVERNQTALKQMGLAQDMTSFAFPYGEATPASKRILGERFSTLRGVRSRINRGEVDLNLLKSVPLDGGPDGIAKAIEAAEALTLHPGWLVFYAHDVQENPSEWGCRPDQLRTVCDAVERSGARVMTVGDAANLLEGLTGATS